MAEIFPNIHRIDSLYQGRIIASYLLVGKQSLLIDSGFAFSPEQTILPYLDDINFPINRISRLVITHASSDHCGGNHVIKRYSPQTCIIAHALDSESISNHSVFISKHIDFLKELGVVLDDIKLDDPNFLTVQGLETAVDWIVRGGEKIDIDDDWSVILLHAPGHTPGHLMVSDPKHRALFTGDALMGNGIPDAFGHLVMPPHYFDINWYKLTIKRARQNNPEIILASHYPIILNNAVKDFLAASDEFVSEFHGIIIDILHKAHNSLPINIIIKKAREIIGIPDSQYQYGLLIYAHLKTLVENGRVFHETENGLNLWRLSESVYA